MDKKAIDESIKFRKIVTTLLSGSNGLSESIYWLAAHIGKLKVKVEMLDQEVKTLNKKGGKDEQIMRTKRSNA